MRKESEESRKQREEFEAKQAEMLDDVPVPFRSPLAHLAWEQGHSCGYSEVLSVLDDLISALQPAWDEYRRNIESRY